MIRYVTIAVVSVVIAVGVVVLASIAVFKLEDAGDILNVVTGATTLLGTVAGGAVGAKRGQDLKEKAVSEKENQMKLAAYKKELEMTQQIREAAKLDPLSTDAQRLTELPDPQPA